MARTAKAKGKTSLYDVHPGVEMMVDWVAGLKAKTGKSLEEWIAVVRASAKKTEKEQREWLKSRFQLGTNSAWWIAERAAGKGFEDCDPAMYLQAAIGF